MTKQRRNDKQEGMTKQRRNDKQKSGEQISSELF
jgi:hypothetical protein